MYHVSSVNEKSSDRQAVRAVIAGLPGPARIVTLAGARKRFVISSATASAALSIRTMDGIPSTCDVFASASAISCPVSRYFIVPSSPRIPGLSGICPVSSPIKKPSPNHSGKGIRILIPIQPGLYQFSFSWRLMLAKFHIALIGVSVSICVISMAAAFGTVSTAISI